MDKALDKYRQWFETLPSFIQAWIGVTMILVIVFALIFLWVYICSFLFYLYAPAAFVFMFLTATAFIAFILNNVFCG